MTRPIDELRTDHALVHTGLAVLAGIGSHVRLGGQFPAEDTATTLSFLREFLVATHFRKENEIVWPALALHGDEAATGAVGEMMRTQAEATELITALVVFWEPVGELTDDERRGFADTVDALVAQVGRMQATEEELFDACLRSVPPDDRIDWIDQFVAVENERASRASWKPRLRRLAAHWAA